MTTQSKALRLADRLDNLDENNTHHGDCGDAASELRRLQARVEVLEVALQDLLYWDNGKAEYAEARALLKGSV